MSGSENRSIVRLALVLVGLAALALVAIPVLPAQPGDNPATNTGMPYNPYNGRGATDRSGYNPLTRSATQAADAYNPYTGANRAASPAPNPYLGAPQAPYNPLTNRYGSRAEQRSVPGSYQRRRPIFGKIGPGLERLDEVMLALLEKHGIPGGALAIVKDGKLVAARGYGWGNLMTAAPIVPDAVFGIASLSKTLTAVAVLKLVEQGKLGLEDRVFRLLSDLRIPPGARSDPRLHTITVRQLLNHSGGWNRNISGEPWSYSWRVANRLRVPLPINTYELGCYMLGQRLDFTPGTQSQYSNYGYILLGQVIEKVSGMSHGDYIARNVLKPMGLRRTYLPGRDRGYHDDEVRLYAPGTYQLISSDFLGVLGDAAAGWRSSAVDLARFLAAMDGTRAKPFLAAAQMKEMLSLPPPPIKANPAKPHVGLGWDAAATKKEAFGYFKDGHLPGCRTFMGRTLAGVNYVILFNSGEMLLPAQIESELHPRHGVEKSLASTTKWPDVDYFDSFR